MAILQVHTTTKNELLDEVREIIRSEINLIQKKESIEYITVKEAADLLRVAEVTIFDYFNRGVLKKRKIGRRTLILKRDILEAVKEIQ